MITSPNVLRPLENLPVWPNNLNLGVYSGKSLDVSAQETAPHGVAFSTDGTKVYVLGITNDTIYQYALTVPWDVSTGVYVTKFLSVGVQDNTPNCLVFSPDGTKAYIAGSTNEAIYQYALTVPWDISTGAYANKSLSTSTQETNIHDVAFSSDGTKVYAIGEGSNTIYQYTLTVPWDVSTGVYSDKSLSVLAQEGKSNVIVFSSDGTKVYVLGVTNDTIYQYALTVPWDVSTGVYANKSLSVNAQESFPAGITFSSDGTKAYVVGTTNDTIYQYNLT